MKFITICTYAADENFRLYRDINLPNIGERRSFSCHLPVEASEKGFQFYYYIFSKFGGQVFWHEVLEFSWHLSNVMFAMDNLSAELLPVMIVTAPYDKDSINDAQNYIINTASHLGYPHPLQIIYVTNDKSTISLEEFHKLEFEDEYYLREDKQVFSFEEIIKKHYPNSVEFLEVNATSIEEVLIKLSNLYGLTSNAEYRPSFKFPNLQGVQTHHSTLGIGSRQNKDFIRQIIPQLNKLGHSCRIWIAYGKPSKQIGKIDSEFVIKYKDSIVAYPDHRNSLGTYLSLFLYLEVEGNIYDNVLTLEVSYDVDTYQKNLHSYDLEYIDTTPDINIESLLKEIQDKTKKFIQDNII